MVRLSAIGDLMFASPLVHAARRAWPAARITWLVEPTGAPLLRGHPDLDAVLEWPGARLRALARSGHWRALFGLLREQAAVLRAQRFDVAIDLQGLWKSALPTRLSGAPRRIGLDSREGSAMLMTEVVARPPPGDPANARIASEYLHLARTLGWPHEPFPLALHVDDATAARAAALVRKQGIDGDYAVFCAFTTRPQKHWFATRWAELAQRVRAEFGLPALLLGGPDDRAAGAALAAQAAPGVLHDLTGQTGLLEAAALIRRARLVVAVDTGLGHMGIAFERPTLLLFGATCPYTDTTSPDARVLYHPLPCSPCRRRPTCDGAFTCMRLLGVEEVLAAIARLLADTGDAGSAVRPPLRSASAPSA